MKIETRSDYVQVRHWLLDKTDFLLAVKVIGSGGFKAGAARGKTKKGTLWWRHHTQPTVISTFDQA